MLPHTSTPELLALHSVRLLGFADEARLAARYGLARELQHELLADFHAYGLVTRSGFGATTGWSVTPRGLVADTANLAAELESTGSRPLVADAHARYVPLNSRFQDAATRWQVRAVPGDPLASNDHTDFRWDARVIDDLCAVTALAGPLCSALADGLSRFAGYHARLTAAVARIKDGQHRWLDGLGIDSAHTVWMQLHEDLLSTLGLDRDGSN